ncbi:MAG: hypothetical protein Q8P67_17715 [archaeon]|nr:hypothetical protein [archaeon]
MSAAYACPLLCSFRDDLMIRRSLLLRCSTPSWIPLIRSRDAGESTSISSSGSTGLITAAAATLPWLLVCEADNEEESGVDGGLGLPADPLCAGGAGAGGIDRGSEDVLLTSSPDAMLGNGVLQVSETDEMEASCSRKSGASKNWEDPVGVRVTGSGSSLPRSKNGFEGPEDTDGIELISSSSETSNTGMVC